MGYERDDRGYGRPGGDYGRGDNARYGYGRGDGGRGEQGRGGYGGYGGSSGGGYGRQGPDRGRPSDYDYDDRGFFQRAGDEVRSWFGDEEAERRRRYDERYDDRYEGQDRGGSYGGGYGYRGPEQGRSRSDYGPSGAGTGGYGAGSYGGDRSSSGSYGGGRQAQGQQQHAHDHNYRSWRDRQMESYDRDYDEYRRENQSRFENEFTTYRGRRDTQRSLLSQVQEHQEVVGSDGQHVGTVDHVKGDRLKLTKTDKDAGGHHHSIPSSWIESIDDGKVKISKTADQAKAAWREEAEEGDKQRGGLFGSDSNRDNADNNDWKTGGNLNRSFSGTY